MEVEADSVQSGRLVESLLDLKKKKKQVSSSITERKNAFSGLQK